MATLEIRDLHVSVEAEGGLKEILRGVDLTVQQGETHAIMGERLRQVHPRLLRRRAPKYKVTSGQSCSTARTCCP